MLCVDILMCGGGCKMLMWEDGYCRGRGGSGDCYGEIEGVDPVRKSFRKMSNQLYNYGEGWVLGRSYLFIIFLVV